MPEDDIVTIGIKVSSEYQAFGKIPFSKINDLAHFITQANEESKAIENGNAPPADV